MALGYVYLWAACMQLGLVCMQSHPVGRGLWCLAAMGSAVAAYLALAGI